MRVPNLALPQLGRRVGRSPLNSNARGFGEAPDSIRGSSLISITCIARRAQFILGDELRRLSQVLARTHQTSIEETQWCTF